MRGEGKASKEMKKDYDKLFDQIITEISDNGSSLLKALEGKMSSSTFYEMLKDDFKSKTYARACETRADRIADEIIAISDSTENKDNVIVQRDRLRVDSRKWLLAKLQPKKYGDKLDIEHSGNVILHFDKDDEQA